MRGEVVSQYTLIDEQLGSKICRYMFDNKKFMSLWKTKKFERFNVEDACSFLPMHPTADPNSIP